MSDVQNTTATADQIASNSTQQPELQASTADPAVTDGPAVESKPEASGADDQLKIEAAAADDKPAEPTPAAEKVVEPITEGQLNYKGPGLLKSLIASKKDFWLTDEPCTAHELSSYLRGEKPDVAHPVVAWATQTGKGLLFFNKKGDTNRKQPGHVLALYDSTDLRRRNPQEISFSIAGHEHVLKAATDAERDAWFVSLEKSTELAKAQKEQIVDSEGYKEELEKLNKPHVTATAAAVASKRGQSQPKKSTDGERPTSDAEEETKKGKKARSTSRGVLNRLKGKKDEAAEPKKEEKEADKENIKPEDEEHKTEEAAAVGIAGAGAAAVGAAAIEEEKKDSEESPAEAAKTEEKPKQSKRGSIFGKIGGWGAMKSPTKEKDAELKPEVPAKDTVAEEAPVLPETATTERTDPDVEADKIEAKAEKEVEQEHAAEEAKKEEVATPAKEKSGFLSGLLPKRNRSVSPSANLTKTEPEAAKETTEETTTTETPAAEAVATESAEKTEEPAKADTSTANKRQSVLGSLGRRASKAMSGMRAPKKENVGPAGEATKEETVDATADAATDAEKPLVNGEAITTENGQAVIGDVVPSAITTNEQPRAVTAAA